MPKGRFAQVVQLDRGHAGQKQGAAQELHRGQDLAQDEEGENGGESWLKRDDDVGDACVQQTEADVVEAVSAHSGDGAEQDEHDPAVPSPAKPEHVHRRHGGAGKPAAGQVDQKKEDACESENVQQCGPGRNTPFRGHTAHEAVGRVAQAGQQSDDHAKKIGLPGRCIERSGNEGASAKAKGDGSEFEGAQALPQEFPAQNGGIGHRTIDHDRGHGRAVVCHGQGPQPVEPGQHQTEQGQEGDVGPSDPQQAGAQDEHGRDEGRNHDHVAPAGQNQGGDIKLRDQVADEDGGRGQKNCADQGGGVALGGTGHGHGSVSFNLVLGVKLI